MWKDFKDFAVKGNVLDMAIGIIIGAAFGTIVQSLVKDIISPPIGLLLANVNFNDMFILIKPGLDITPPYATLADAQAAGAITMNYGLFINNVISFLIVSSTVFLVIKMVSRLKKKEQNIPPAEPTTKNCPYCQEMISLKAVRCPHCTSEIKAT